VVNVDALISNAGTTALEVLKKSPGVTVDQCKVSVKVDPGNIAQTVALLKANWAKYFPGDQFDYYFLDKHFKAQYNADQRFGKVFGIFTLIAIFVACLGLFGLVSYTIVQRTREIGIRKVLGSSVNGILGLLYKDFAFLVVVAFFIAAPIAWYAIATWLNGYAFRITINPMPFVLPFFIVLVVAFATVSWLSVKAALMNPVKSLKTE
jgi:putative ABC transport system permease protein